MIHPGRMRVLRTINVRYRNADTIILRKSANCPIESHSGLFSAYHWASERSPFKFLAIMGFNPCFSLESTWLHGGKAAVLSVEVGETGIAVME
jgi:hypothetical protein